MTKADGLQIKEQGGGNEGGRRGLTGSERSVGEESLHQEKQREKQCPQEKARFSYSKRVT